MCGRLIGGNVKLTYKSPVVKYQTTGDGEANSQHAEDSTMKLEPTGRKTIAVDWHFIFIFIL